MFEPAPRVIEGERFDAPLVMHGAIDAEPQRYIAEKPYDLTKFEFTLLRKRVASQFWYTLLAGATAGLIISVVGKALAALLEKKVPTVDSWELWGVLAGTVGSLLLKFVRSKDENERLQLEKVVEGHFSANRPRRVHLTNNQEAK